MRAGDVDAFLELGAMGAFLVPGGFLCVGWNRGGCRDLTVDVLLHGLRCAASRGTHRGAQARAPGRLGVTGELFGERIFLVLEDFCIGRELDQSFAVEAHDDDGDVVVAAGVVRALRELLAGIERLWERTQDFANLFVTHHAGEAVRAEKEHVPLSELGVREIDLHAVGRAERLKNDVVVLESLGLFFGELARFDKLIHERLIAGDLHEVIAAEDVAARIPDLRKEEMIVDEGRRGDRRPHAAPGAIDLGFLEDAQTGGFDRAYQAPGEVVTVERNAGIERVDHALVDDVDRELTGDLACCSAAHAVANGEEATVGADVRGAIGFEEPARPHGEIGDEEVVFVVLADLPHVGARKQLHLDGSGRRRRGGRHRGFILFVRRIAHGV